MSGVIKTPAIQNWCPYDWAIHGMVYKYGDQFFRAKWAHQMHESCAPPKAHDLWDAITPSKLK